MRSLSGENFVTLGRHFQSQMTSSMQNFRHLWSNVQDLALAGLASTVKQIASILKMQCKHNDMGYLGSGLIFNFRSIDILLSALARNIIHIAVS